MDHVHVCWRVPFCRLPLDIAVESFDDSIAFQSIRHFGAISHLFLLPLLLSITTIFI